MPHRHLALLVACALFGLAAPPAAAVDAPTRDDALAVLKPFDGPTTTGVDASTLAGKVMCGYQGWYTCPGDGAARGWAHYGRGDRFEPGRCTIDLWPDVAELGDEEKFATGFRHADGSVAYVYSAHNRQSVLRHFRWLREYGIDGVFVQRFAVETVHPANLNHCNVVLAHCREGANAHGRAYALMYDLSGLPAGGAQTAIDDWKLLVERMKLGRDERDRAYLRHRGRPVVAVWGIGFNDGRAYTLAECRELVRFLKDDPQYGGNTVLVGVPTGWRTLDADCVADQLVHEIVAAADIVSPWTVGRYRTEDGARRHAAARWQPDAAWCRERGLDYLPVVFPGFSWHNLKGRAPFNEIPRRGGRFLWSQYVAAVRGGATMIYQAMFDEMDEGTAIFKCTGSPPVGTSPFLDNEGLPSDHYLWLVGQGGQLLRGQLPASDELPPRPASPAPQ